MKATKTEVSALVEALKASSALEEAASTLYELVYQMLADRCSVALLFMEGERPVVVWGFPTILKAEQWAEKQDMKPGQAAIAALHTPETIP